MKTNTLLTAGAMLAMLPMSASAVTIALDTTPTTGPLDLTALGATDWMAFGDGAATAATDFVAEKDGANFIQTVTGGPADWAASDWDGAPWQRSWTDGASPNTTGTSLNGSLEAKSSTGLTSLTFDVDNLAAGDYQMLIYATAYRSTGYDLTATLSGGGADFTVSGSAFNGATNVFTIDFTVTTGQSLNVLFEQTAIRGNGVDDNIGFSAITLNSVAVPEPSSTALLGLGGLALILRRRK